MYLCWICGPYRKTEKEIGIEKRQTCRNAGTQSFGTWYAFEKNGYGRPAAVIIEILYDCSFFIRAG